MANGQLDPGEDYNGNGVLDPVLGERWFRFTTLGDGKPGDQIVLSPEPSLRKVYNIEPRAGAVTDTGGTFVVAPDNSTLLIGGPDNHRTVFELDLTDFMEFADDPERLEEVLLLLDWDLARANALDPSAGFVPSLRLTNPGDFTVFNGELYFVAENSEVGRELWKTDGTRGGTSLVLDFNEGSIGSAFGAGPALFTALGDQLLFFVIDNGRLGRELWVTDGTVSGTSSLGAGGVDSVALVGGTLYFEEGNGNLMQSDGTPSGTVAASTTISGQVLQLL